MGRRGRLQPGLVEKPGAGVGFCPPAQPVVRAGAGVEGAARNDVGWSWSGFGTEQMGPVGVGVSGRVPASLLGC